MNSMVAYGVAGLAVLGIGALVIHVIEQLAEPTPGRIYDEARLTYEEWYARFGLEVRDEDA